MGRLTLKQARRDCRNALSSCGLIGKDAGQSRPTPIPTSQIRVNTMRIFPAAIPEEDSEATISAMTCYARALAESIREVSDAELDRMIESLGGAVMVAGMTA